VAVLVYDAVAGVPASRDVPSGIDDLEFIAAWHSAHRCLDETGDALPGGLRDVAMSGWETVAAAHAIALRYSDPLEAIGRAAASGGDTDTIASIVGAIAGARDGGAVFPRELVERLSCHETLTRIVNDLWLATTRQLNANSPET